MFFFVFFVVVFFVAPAGGERDIVITASVWCLCVCKYVSVCVRLDFVHAITSLFML